MKTLITSLIVAAGIFGSLTVANANPAFDGYPGWAQEALDQNS